MSGAARGFPAFALRYAMSGIWRNKRRTILTILTVGLSVSVTTVTVRYSGALIIIWEQGTIDHGTAHAQYHVKGYDAHPDVLSAATSFAVGDAVEGKLTGDSQVEAMVRRLNFEGVISAGSKTVYFIGHAVEPAPELKVGPEVFHPGADEGEFVKAAADAGGIPGVALGKGLATSLGLKVGDEATVLIHTMKGAVNGVDVKVAGIVEPPVEALSKRLLYMDLGDAQKALEFPARYNEIAVRLKPGVNSELWVKGRAQEAQASGFDLKGWWDLDPLIRRIEAVWDSVLGVITLLMFLSAGISVLNIIYMTVAERTVEIGTLMAIGAKGRDVRRLITLEAALIGIFGSIAGSLFGNSIVLVMDVVGIPFDSPFGAGFVVAHPKVSLLASLAISVMAVVICFVAALIPARKAALVEPVTAFRGQIT